jgi:hypothetical protein
LHFFQTILSRKAAIQERIGLQYASQDFRLQENRDDCKKLLQALIASADCKR